MALGEFARRCGGRLEQAHPDDPFAGFALDSREAGPGDLFVAIHGARADGADYVPDALSAGCAATLAERDVIGPQIRVDSIVEALASFARSCRDEFEGTVLAVTGSAGKTSAKEFLTAALEPTGPVVRTGGNRNTEYTAPLIWAEVGPETKFVVIEMSMRGPGQIAHLAAMARPHIGVVTNIGSNHFEMVGSREGIARAKGELLQALPHDGVAVLWAEDPYAGLLQSLASCPVRKFGWGEGAEVRIAGYRPLDWMRSEVQLEAGGASVSLELPVCGRHFAQNAAAAMAAALAAGADLRSAAVAMQSARLPELRMQPVTRDGLTVVFDNYNAAPEAFLAALDTLSSLPAEGRRIVVAGEMRELGQASEEAHREVGRAIAEAADVAVFWGNGMRWARESAVEAGMPPVAALEAASLDDVARLAIEFGPGDVVLVKGSRALELERAFPEFMGRAEVRP